MDKVTLLSLAMDLKRITTSIQRGSDKSAERFSEEAKRWITNDIEDDYLKDLMEKITKSLNKKNDLAKAEDCLMYSVLIQNQALYGNVVRNGFG